MTSCGIRLLERVGDAILQRLVADPHRVIPNLDAVGVVVLATYGTFTVLPGLQGKSLSSLNMVTG
jgi:hypothetical protein